METPAPRLPFSLHALIAEAKQRARRRRLLGAVLFLAIAATATGLALGLSGGGAPATRQASPNSEPATSKPAAPAPCHDCNVGTPGQQSMLDGAAYDAQKIAGPYFTGAVVRDSTNSVKIYLAHAPQSVVSRLHKAYRGTYAIKNDAPRPLSAVMKLMGSIRINAAVKAAGITVSELNPTQDGHVHVGVTDHVAEAQAILDAKYGRGAARVVHQSLATYVD